MDQSGTCSDASLFNLSLFCLGRSYANSRIELAKLHMREREAQRHANEVKDSKEPDKLKAEAGNVKQSLDKVNADRAQAAKDIKAVEAEMKRVETRMAAALAELERKKEELKKYQKKP